ncbi:phage tail protein [Chryseobacterium lathyri]|uniref:phage tail protein n=1 Tax=Chryseobacterium lathyri TaxID=395933 RepID=UPI001CBC14B3|nr:phage tail protein [Chryseobacterium lathyri]
MKKKLIILTAISFSILGFSQVGINTANPQGILNVDGAKDNPASGAPTAAQQLNDFTVTNTGNVGVGTTTPNSNAALDVTSPNKGVKLPSVALVATNDSSPLSAHIGGMIVYNTATAGTVPNNVIPGLYVNDGTKWVNLETPGEGVPPGSVFYRASSTVPTGYLECDGSEVSRTDYAVLFSVIATTYGAGDGSTTFKLPDLRGEFIRGWDNARGIDSGRLLGTWQKGSFLAGGAGPNADSIIPFVNSSSTMPTLAAALGWDLPTTAQFSSIYGATVRANNSQSTGATITLSTPSNTANDFTNGASRPRNTALMPIIKY